MARLPHIEKIMKLLVLSGKGNPNSHEREVAREKAEALMARHGVTRDQMRECYRQDHGLPPKPSAPGAGREAPQRDPFEQARLEREALAREEAARASAAKARMARAQAEREQAAREREEKERLTTRLRTAIDQAMGTHRDFADFIDSLSTLGIQVVVPAEGAVERMIYRWPPHKIALHGASLGAGYDWPSLVQAGLQFDPRQPRHREALAMMFMG
jgi:hypothetical protein